METKNKFSLPRFTYFFFGFGLLSIVFYAIAMLNTNFADFFNRYVSSILRGTMATITNVIPLSCTEILIITSPISAFFLIRFCLKKFGSSWRDVGKFMIIVGSIALFLFGFYICLFGIGYHTSELDKKLDLEKKEVSATELAKTAEWLIEQVNAEIDNVDFVDKGSSIMPYYSREMNNLLVESYYSLSEKYNFLPRLNSYIKPIMLSGPMTYTHISGVYTFFTGEANLNVNSPDYCMPYTAAHELAHQRGIAREDEANFIAFLVCVNSDDAYIRYCGYLNLCEYVLNALYGADSKLWEETYKKLDNRAIYEMIAYNDFYEKYRDNVVGEISGAINDAYLQANGTQGTRSYGLVVDLAVAYFHKEIEN